MLTTILQMTNILEAGLKERLNSNADIKMYDILITLLDDTEKQNILNSQEETSYIVEYKTSYLLVILLNKNEKAKEYLYTKLNITDVIERKCESYKNTLEVVIEGIKNKDGFSDNKVNIILESVKKFYEFCYNIIINDPEKINYFFRNCIRFNQLLEFINRRRSEMGMNKEFDVYIWLNKLYRDSIDNDTFN